MKNSSQFKLFVCWRYDDELTENKTENKIEGKFG